MSRPIREERGYLNKEETKVPTPPRRRTGGESFNKRMGVFLGAAALDLQRSS